MKGRGELVVNAYSEKWLRRGFPWVYPKEVESGGAPAGQEVLLRSARGEPLGRAIADGGWLAARVYRQDAGPLDAAWLGAVLDRAAGLRQRVIDPGTTAYRLVNAENDALPGVRVDWWDHYATVVLDSAACAPLVPGIVRWLVDRRDPRGIYVHYRPDPRDTAELRGVEGGLVHGHAPTGDVRVTERGLAFLVRPQAGPDTGLYLDMRGTRAWLEPHWGGRSVLNTFAYTGAFSVAAARNGAAEVVSVDLSEAYLERAEANFRANELDDAAHEVLAEDVFKALDRFRRKERRFDVVILDPPAYSHGVGTWSAKKDYPRLVAAACRVLAPDGWLVAASNQGEISPREFNGWLEEGLQRAERRAQLLHTGDQGPDFPAASWFPEGRYLKVGVWRVL